jgi:hypothetical protein
MFELKQKGAGLVEVVVGAAIVTLVVISLLATYGLYLTQGLENVGRVQAALISEEGIEALKFMRDASWTTNIVPLTASSTYYLVYSGGIWDSTTSPVMIDGKFVRTFTLYNVSRDTNSNIVTSGGTNDPGTKKATVSVSWRISTGTTTKQVSTYLFDLYGN